MTPGKPGRESLIDAHVHWYPGVRLGDLLDQGFRNLRAQARGDAEAGCALVLTLSSREPRFGSWRGRTGLWPRPLGRGGCAKRTRTRACAPSAAGTGSGSLPGGS
jgi:hypothetical protein